MICVWIIKWKAFYPCFSRLILTLSSFSADWHLFLFEWRQFEKMWYSVAALAAEDFCCCCCDTIWLSCSLVDLADANAGFLVWGVLLAANADVSALVRIFGDPNLAAFLVATCVGVSNLGTCWFVCFALRFLERVFCRLRFVLKSFRQRLDLFLEYVFGYHSPVWSPDRTLVTALIHHDPVWSPDRILANPLNHHDPVWSPDRILVSFGGRFGDRIGGPINTGIRPSPVDRSPRAYRRTILF